MSSRTWISRLMCTIQIYTCFTSYKNGRLVDDLPDLSDLSDLDRDPSDLDRDQSDLSDVKLFVSGPFTATKQTRSAVYS